MGKPKQLTHTVGYLKLSEQNLERLTHIKTRITREDEGTQVEAMIRGRLKLDRNACRTLAIRDAEHRGLSCREYGRIVSQKGYRALPGGPLLEVPVDPLAKIGLGGATQKKPIGKIRLGLENLVLLRTRIAYSGLTGVDFLSRLVQNYLDRKWDTVYAPQLEASYLENWDDLAEQFKASTDWQG